MLARDIATPTITGLYDVGSPAGTYVPGKDFSPIDNVSTGTTAQLNFSIAFDSISNQLYPLDKVYIQSVDDPRTDGTGRIPGRWINQIPDPTDITDDGLNVVIPNYNASMSSIVFDSTANIQSNSTVTTGITATLPPAGFWWKSKIMPKIQVVAEKDGILAVSDPLQLPTILLSTAGVLDSTLTSSGNILYTSVGGVKGFIDPISMFTTKDYVPNITRILDQPDYEQITYEVNYTAAVNGTQIPLTAADFAVFSLAGGSVESLSYAAGLLTVVMRQTTPGTVGIGLNCFIPFDATGLTQATVSVNGQWQTLPPTVTNFRNGYLFTQVADGATTRTVVVDTSGQPPARPPYIQESIYGSLENENIFQNLTINNYSCFESLDSVFLRMIDSGLASFGPNLDAVYSFTDQNTGAVGGPIPADSYVALYGHFDFPASYDPNDVAQSILAGAITMRPYADVIAAGQVPNLSAVTLTKDLFAGHTVDTSIPINFQFNGDLDVISQAEFAALYDSDPKDLYPTYVYSYLSLATCYTSAADGYAAVGDLLATVDSLQQRGGTVFLNLGTNPPSVPNTVMRFHATSFVRADLPLSTIDANIQYVITRTDGTTISTITDYTQTYCLMYRWTSQGGSDNAQTHIPAGTMLTVTLPQALVPYLYLAGMPYIQVPTNGGPVVTVPIPDYSLSGTQLELTTPIALDMLPNSICAPVRFLTPANDLTSTFVSLDFSQPLVYTEKPDSLLYGFTTDSLLFRVNTITSAFTLKGAQVDTTGLSVSPEVYERGQAVTYIATVYNQSYAPSSDYCMGITVPTNQYNPVESSNNSLPAFITAINPTNPNTVVYFQTEANVTALDIQVLKVINQPGVPSLQQYFNTVAVQNWTRYTGQALPGDVVMFIGCTPGVPQNSLVRIDYNVVVDVPAGADTLYTNDAVFNYDSSGANLEAQSNMVTIRNRIPEPIPIVKTPPVQTHPLENGVAVNFVAYFTAPMDPTLFEQFTITDVLHPSLTLDAANTTVVVYPNTPVAHTTALDPATNTLTIGVANTAQTAGKLLAVNIAAIVTDTTPIPTDPVYQQPLFYNTVSLTINDNPGLVSHSEPVLVIFQIPTPTPVPIVKAPATQTQPKENGTMIDFTLRFDAPAETRVYTHFTITDALPPSLTLDVADVTVTALPSTDVPFALTYDPVTNLVTISFDNTAVTAGKTILVTVPTTLTDITKIPASDRIENQARLTFNQIPALYSDSNTVEVRFGGDDRCQAITDLIQSIAMEQAALAHILNAEGEKIQRAIQMDLTLCQILEINQSVQAMINQVTMLERVLQRKLSIIDCDLCTGC